MLSRFLIRRRMACGALLWQCCSIRCLSCSIGAEDSHLIFLLVNPRQFRLCSYLVSMGATTCGGKADSTSMPHSSANMKVWGGALSLLNTTINWGLRNIPELTGEVLAQDIHIIFLIYGFRNLQQMTKMTFSFLLFLLEFMVRSVTAFYRGCWYNPTQSVLPILPL